MGSPFRNSYRCSVEQNHLRRYEVRLEADYGRRDWGLRVFFVASSPERVLSRLLAALRFLHREEDRLWVWGADPSDRALRFREVLGEADLELDRRRSSPRHGGVTLAARAGQPLSPLFIAELKRKLAPRIAAAALASRAAEVLVRSA